MSFINSTRREDMQNEGYSFLASRILDDCYYCFLNGDVTAYHKIMKFVWNVVKQKFTDEERKIIDKDFLELSNMIHGLHRKRTSRHQSYIFDRLDTLHGNLCFQLNKHGLLLKAEEDLNTLLAK